MPLPPPSRHAEGAPAPLARHAGSLVAVAFLAMGLATLGDYGVTWDEPESYRAGLANLRLIAAAFAGRTLPPWPWHELPGYQFAADTLRAAFATMVDRLAGQPDAYLGFRLANLLVTTLAVALVARLALREGSLAAPSGRRHRGGPPASGASPAGTARVLAPLAATLLILQPKLVAHSQANPKDVIGLLAWSAAVLALAHAAHGDRLAPFAGLGAAVGAAVASHASALLLAPLALVWVLAAGRGALRRRLGGLLLAAAVAVPAALALWPWLWASPWQRALQAAQRLRGFDVPLPMRVLYLGSIYRPAALPWHYGLTSLALATPLPVLAAAVAGLAVAALPHRGGALAAVARLCRLAALWLAVLLLADVTAPARYDGARHLLPALPALALLAAGGAYACGAALGRRGAAGRWLLAVLASVFAASLLAVGAALAAIHPYADAFLDLPARLLLGPEAEHRVELEYWGGSYKEGAAWLRDHAPAGSRVLVPMAPQAAAPFLAGRFELAAADGSRRGEGDAARRPQYLMVMTREAWYTPRLRRLVGSERPVFSVRRQGSTLLAIYRLAPS